MNQRTGVRGQGTAKWWVAACCLFATGCVTRSLTIKSEPAGALVYVNDQLKGETPYAYDFQWYGHYRVTLRKDGYERLDDTPLLRAPVHLWIPFDLVMELLPVRIRDVREWSYTLQPLAVIPAPKPPAVQPKPQPEPVEPEAAGPAEGEASP